MVGERCCSLAFERVDNHALSSRTCNQTCGCAFSVSFADMHSYTRRLEKYVVKLQKRVESLEVGRRCSPLPRPTSVLRGRVRGAGLVDHAVSSILLTFTCVVVYRRSSWRRKRSRRRRRQSGSSSTSSSCALRRRPRRRQLRWPGRGNPGQQRHLCRQ